MRVEVKSFNIPSRAEAEAPAPRAMLYSEDVAVLQNYLKVRFHPSFSG